MEQRPRTVFITGCSRGLGYEIAKLFASKDGAWNVVATMRTPTCKAGVELGAMPNVTVAPLDVTSRESVDAAVARLPDGGVDVLINNAAYALVGPLELVTEEQLITQFNTNLFGCIRTMQAVLPAMRKRRSGVIVQISSSVGRATMPLGSPYISTKYALEGLSETCAMELAPYNIKMRIVEPGYISTDFRKSMKLAQNNNEGDQGFKGYQAMMHSFSNMVDEIMQSGGSTPQDVAQVVFEAATSECNKLRWPVGHDALESLKKRSATSDEDHISGNVEKMQFAQAVAEP